MGACCRYGAWPGSNVNGERGREGREGSGGNRAGSELRAGGEGGVR